ncbi:unnamed protein product [Haemonchus placei]|uniref:Uncharacterized protein n=1 Tax=Haemonchus placei TaxID=6290 RepID=A0A0N4WXI5_HAEPC|nr:unnamed protein product [Haemonchus placei]
MRVQLDLFIKCPDEIGDEPLKSFTRRRRGKKPKDKGKRDSVRESACGRISERKDSFFMLACLRAGVVEDPRKWWEVPRAMEFSNHLTRQLMEYDVQLESLKVPKSMKPGAPVHAVDKKGGPPIMDGRISTRHLKGVEKRQGREDKGRSLGDYATSI